MPQTYLLYELDIRTPQYLSKRTHMPCTEMFIAAFFVIAENCQEPKCPSKGINRMNKLQYSHMMEYYSLVERNMPIDRHNRDESQNNCAEGKETDQKGGQPLWFHLTLENAN